MCTHGASTTAIATALAVHNLTLPDDNSVPTPGNLNRYLSAYQYHDDCTSSNCVGRVPLELFIALSSKYQLYPTRTVTPLRSRTCDRVVKGRSFVFLETASKVQYLVTRCHSKDNNYVYVRNTMNGKDELTPLSHFVESTLIHMSRRTHSLTTVPKSYPLYKQCDGRWGQHMMVTKTLCAVGCLVSSVSMALNGWGIKSNGHPSNPGSLNDWLRGHSGYVDGNLFAMDRLPNICPSGSGCTVTWPTDGYHGNNDLNSETIIGYLARKRIVIAHVREKTHFVLGIGWMNDRKTLLVNDPAGRNETRFNMATGVNGWRLYDFKI